MLYNTPTDEFTTILQLVVQQIHHQVAPTDKNLPHPNILTCRDVGFFWHCDVANFCPLVVYNMSVAGVRV